MLTFFWAFKFKISDWICDEDTKEASVFTELCLYSAIELVEEWEELEILFSPFSIVIFSPFKLADLSACKVEPVIAILPLVLILISSFEFKVLLIDFEVSKLALS